MHEPYRVHPWLALTLLAALLTGTALFPMQAAAQQMSIAAITITRVQEDKFPQVELQAIVRDGNNNTVPDSDIANLELVENGQLVPYQHQRVTAGVEVIYVLDAGLGVNNAGVSGRPRLEQMKDVVKAFVNTMVPGDTAGITLVNAATVTYPQPLTSDQVLLSKSADTIAADPGALSAGLSGVLDALSELSKSPQKGHVVQAVILLTSGIQTGTANLNKVIDQAAGEGVFVHTLLVRDDLTSQAAQLEHIANGTRGLYTHYTGQTSLKKLQDWIGEQRVQHLFRFASTQGISSDRTLELRTKVTGAGLVSDSETYQVTLLPPRVVLDAPASNTELVRKAESYDADLDQVSPTSIKVTAHVEWPDNHARGLKEATFWLDNVQTGTALSFPTPDRIAFDWDLRSYRAATSTPVQIEVRVVDEFDMTGKSDAAQIKLTVLIPPAPISETAAIVKSACEGQEGFALFRCQVVTQAKIMVTTPSGWISLISMLVALVAVVFAVRFRGRLAEAGGAALDVVRETITRLTRPGNTEVGAYLEVLRGDDTLTGKQIPLYIRTVTPAGRSPQEAELVFDMTNERSVVSRRHCEFRDDDGIFKIRDLGSTHGTFVNGIRLPEGGDGQVLSDADRIELGPVERGGVLVVFHAAGQFKPQDGSDEDYRTNPAWQE